MGFLSNVIDAIFGNSKDKKTRVKKQVVGFAPRKQAAQQTKGGENDWKMNAAKRQLDVWKKAAAKEDELSKKRKTDEVLKKI